ncbi:LegC family aminotransferase [Mucilaginibacter sp. L3T2-6]|uniref:LegC family aminotransferase n=1 Tax=Mucilaginibacter sp. L3T2-6 TaxID=3062491 RepID=UPI0026758AD7|nr:LegC family aminotransferase [Mucilaginibacter sp. L3T2-6]MDO3642481.1 LegC family aminotransferase [Mucilaginibacter sp. L3T2-6]MDV6215123.1 LegC family aminotransferase [Mucilaginibacter sp. L3T2-6]
MSQLFKDIADFIKSQFPDLGFIPLHAPVFIGNERKYVIDTIDSTFVSSVGAYVDLFEQMMCRITGASFAIATVNGTNALHLALVLANVERGDEVISQSLTFIATCNAISYIGAYPLFLDVDADSLGLSPSAVEKYLENNAELRPDGFTYNKITRRRIKACVPMHTFGLPCRIDEISAICDKWNITLIEDAAESLGSYYKGRHMGVFGKIGTFSFNGNKTVTSGGGGALVTDDQALAKRAKHLTTQAKVPHAWAFVHDEIGYNYRMPNLNAALACAQLEQLNTFVTNKRELAAIYHRKFNALDIKYCKELPEATANYWLNTVLLENKQEREDFLAYMNSNGVMSRPIWELMHHLPMFEKAERGDLSNSEWIADRLVNIPSSVRLT